MNANKVLAGSLTAILATMGGGFTQPSQAEFIEINGKQLDIAKPGEYVPGEFVIRFENGVSTSAATAMAGQLNATVKKSIPQFGLILLKVPSDQSVPAAMEQARKMPGVKAAFRNSVMSIPRPPESPLPNGPDGNAKKLVDEAIRQESPNELGNLGIQAAPNNQWHLHAINWYNAGAQPASTPMVAVIDTGVDYDHPDLAANVVKGWDFVDEDADPMDEAGHGTHCAGIVAATGAVNVNGVSTTSKVLAVRVLDRYGSGSWFNVAAGIVYAASQQGVKVLSLSLGGYAYESDPEYQALMDVIDTVYSGGKLPVIAAGNEDNLVMYEYPGARVIPGWYPNSFTVAATNTSDSKSAYSNYNVGTLGGTNWNFNFVDIAAPGNQILSTLPLYQWGELSGTSMATPMVAGAAARYWGTAGNEGKTPGEVATQLKNTGYSLTAVYGFPIATKRLDLAKAMGSKVTGFTGQVFNAQNTAPLQGVKVSAKAGGVVKASATTDDSGSFTLGGLTGGTTYSLVYAKTGYSALAGSMKATGGTLLRMTKPVFMNQNRPADQFSVVVDWRSWEPGYYEGRYTLLNYLQGWYPWIPFEWTQTAGTFMSPYIRSEGASNALIQLNDPGALSTAPYMRLVNDPYGREQPVSTFVVQPQANNTYYIFTELDNFNSYVAPTYYYEWGSYKTKSGYSIPNIKARIYKGGSLKLNIAVQSATGSGAYWHIATIKPDGTVTPVNKLLAAAP